MRVQAGGGATIYGILYQMLWCLLTVTSMRVTNPIVAEGEISQATLLLEPSNGGDALLRDSDVEQVIQLKARSNATSWSLQDVVDDVLPDLYRAVRFDREQKFILLTEGHIGEWKTVYEFFQQLRGRIDISTDGPLPPLVESGQSLRFRGVPLNENELIRQIATLLREQNPHIRRDSEEEVCRKLLRLLSRFEFRGRQTERYLRTQLLHHLRSLVDNPDSVMVTMRSLLMDLGERAIAGNAPIEAGTFFAEHGIRGVPLTRRQWPRLIEIADVQLRHVLTHRFAYNPSEDVRPGGATLLAATEVDSWRRGGADCLVLQGESGQGKSWRLCSLALALSEEAPVVIVSADGDPRQVLESAAHEFWFGVCNRGGTMQLDQIERYLDQTNTVVTGSTWLYLLVDGIQTPRDADRLCREVAGVSGVRLAFTTSERTAELFGQAASAPTIVAMKVDNFTEPELRQYIADGNAVRWHAILDAEVKRIISYPLLAYIYRTLPGARDWDGTNEYRLYNAYLSGHILGHLSEGDLFTAELAFNRAGLSLWKDEQYPWSPEQMEAFGFDKDLIAALRGTDFLQWDIEQMCYKVRHDRLKEWLAARALFTALVNGRVDLDDVARQFKLVLLPDPWHSHSEEKQRQQMRYVPMDVIWYLAQRNARTPRSADVLDGLLRRLDKEPEHFRSGEVLYEGYMPTVGPEIAPAVFRRLVAMADEPDDRRTRRSRDDYQTRKSMIACLAGLDARVVSPIAVGNLDHHSTDVRHASLTILAARPIGNALPVLWNRLLTLKEKLAVVRINPPESSSPEEEAMPVGSFSVPGHDIVEELTRVRHALSSSVSQSPEWLLQEIKHLSVPDQSAGVRYAADLITLLRHTGDEGRCWREVKERIRAWTETGDDDSDWHCQQEFVNCVYHWRDRDEAEWLRSRVGRAQGRLSADCMRALIRVAPDVALDAIPELPQEMVRHTGDWGLRHLLAQRPDATRRRMAELIESEASRLSYVRVFAGIPGAFPENTLDLLLDFGFATPGETWGKALWHLIGHTYGLVELPHLQRLWQLAGTVREEQLQRLYEETAAKSIHDHSLGKLEKLLSKIAGEGFSHLINFQLKSDQYYVRMGAIGKAHLRPTGETIRLLETLALSGRVIRQHDPSIDQDDVNEPDDASETYAYCAQEALALCRAYKPLIHSVVDRQHRTHESALSAVVDGALSDDDMLPALDALRMNPIHPGAIMALGVGRRADYTMRIASILAAQDAKGDNPITNACHYALVVMPELPLEAVIALGRRLPYTQSGWLLWPALKRNGSPAALRVLMDYLRVGLEKSDIRGAYYPYDFSDLAQVARFLLTQPSVQNEAANLCRDAFMREAELNGPVGEIVSSLAPFASSDAGVKNALDCLPARDYLVRTAFAPQRRREIRAIRGLAAFAPDEAYAAAMRLLDDEQEHVYAPDLLMDIDPVRAIPELFDILIAEGTKLRVRHHIAHAISEETWYSNDGQVDLIRELVERASSSLDPLQRQGACFILGFLPPATDVSEAIHVMMGDEDVRVYETACAAWNRQEAARSVSQLVDAFLTENDPTRRWVLLHAALRRGDPGEAHRAEVPEWLNRMSERLTQLEWGQATKQLEQRCKKRDDALRRAEDNENKDWL